VSASSTLGLTRVVYVATADWGPFLPFTTPPRLRTLAFSASVLRLAELLASVPVVQLILTPGYVRFFLGERKIPPLSRGGHGYLDAVTVHGKAMQYAYGACAPSKGSYLTPRLRLS
jgi:hypothetical protein